MTPTAAIDLTPLALFMAADPVVKTVMAILLFCSVWCWVLTLEALLRLRLLRRDLVGAEASGLAKSARFGEALEAGARSALIDVPLETGGERRARIERAIREAAREPLRAVDRGFPVLATIASATPFIGLLGTVWGIMRSFTAIAGSNDTSLAVVAPGIAEALSATALGLFAAIPAAVAYNLLGARLGALGERVGRLAHDAASRIAAGERAP
ncbi:MAG: flagellar motor protein MotA [Hyphomicrobiales bacterium]|nr:flagellar motor protein MotA [Hyphomicrobiales bacterium]